MRKSEWIMIVIVFAAFAVGAWAYPSLPPTVSSHWDVYGNPSGSIAGIWATFIFPTIIAFLALVFSIIPRVDPKRDNIAKFRKYYDRFVIGCLFVFFWLSLLLTAQYLGYAFNLITAIIPAMAALLWMVGMLLPHTEPNWTIGIRTPWTISDESVWKKIHKQGGPLFKVAAIIGLLGIAFPIAAVWLLVAPVVASAIWLIVYSYVLYERARK